MSLINYDKCSTSVEAFEKVKENITPEVIAKYKVQAQMDYDESAKVITASGKGFTMKMTFYDSNVDLDLDLSFMLKPFKATILEQLEKQVGRVV